MRKACRSKDRGRRSNSDHFKRQGWLKDVGICRGKVRLELKSERFRQKPHQRRCGDACRREAIDEQRRECVGLVEIGDRDEVLAFEVVNQPMTGIVALRWTREHVALERAESAELRVIDRLLPL